MPAPPRTLPFQRRSVDSRSRVNLGPNQRARGGAIVFLPGWEDILAPQILDDMQQLMEVAYARAIQLHQPDVDRGDVKASIGATLDTRDGSVYLYAGHWDAKYTEYGTGSRGQGTYGARGADAFPNAYTPDYNPGIVGLPARPFIRPAGVAAARQVFGD